MLDETFLDPPGDAYCNASFGLRQEYKLRLAFLEFVTMIRLCPSDIFND